MSVVQQLKTVAIVAGAISVLLSLSYCEEMPKYQFEKVAVAVGEQLPGARLIQSFKSGDLASPVSWLRPATTTWVYAIPDAHLKNRFTTIALTYDAQVPSVFLNDVDCIRRTRTVYSDSEDDAAEPALDSAGNLVVSPEGKTYRVFQSNVSSTSIQMTAFCESDWSVERMAISELAH